ncbi:MAG: DUF3482 domain-containing protein [Planctomycetes bacterium]|nr:DUF3482 domain-containing protein [Planctomycetota bacterium]
MPDAGSVEPPTFVVVGNVNQGKSSIVAALTEDASIPIDAMPGTTQRAAEYAFRSGDEVVFRVVDTPGFQRARHALAWLQRHSRSVADRRQTLVEFVRVHAEDPAFVDEVRLLRPILAGGSHIYVVDASAPFEPTAEAEMEILRWTGQSGMAVLNRTRERDHGREWRPILTQFFHLVRDFDAHAATFADRLDLLRAFREVRDEWRAPMQRAVAVMEREWHERTHRAAAAIGGLMVQALAHVEKRPLAAAADAGAEAAARAALATAFAAALRAMEQAARREVERLHGHRGLEAVEDQLALLDADLLGAASFEAFGLTRPQLLRRGLLWGAATGLAVDAMAGGTSLGLGAAIGAGIGGAAAWFGTPRLADVWDERGPLAKVLLPGAVGRFVAAGPLADPRLPWVLLDRALVHARAVRRRSHARRDALDLQGSRQGLVATMPKAWRDDVDAELRALVRAARTGKVAASPPTRLVERLQQALAAP